LGEVPVIRINGYALVVGDDIDTDTIIPARYLHRSEPNWLAQHVFEDAPDIKQRLNSISRPIAVIAGNGFGYGSSREHAVIALKAAGVSLVIAKSFHRIFYRNSINNGLLAVEAHLTGVNDGELVQVDLKRGIITVGTCDMCRIKPIPTQILEILQYGGLKERLRRLASENTDYT